MSSVRKIIVTALAAVAALAVVLTITACGSVTLTGISITTPPSVTNYVVGDVFDTDGMVVTAEYDDGTTKEVTDYTVSPSKFDKAGKQTVTISYEGKTATVEVTVNEVELTTLEVTGTLEKTTYNAGETFSAEGLAVKATYSNESVDEAFEGATFEFSKTGSADWSETLSLAKGDTKVYVRAVCGGVTSAAKEYSVTVNVPAQSVTIEGESLTLYVGNGTTKNTATLTATVAPTDTTDSVTWEIVSGDKFISLDGSTVTAIKAGEAVVRAVAGDKSDTIAITVKDNVIDSITVTGVNVSGSYIEGQALPATAVTATVEMTYTDGTRKLLNSGEYLLEISLTEGSGWGDNVTLPTSGPVSVYIQVTVEGTTVRGTTVSEVVVSEKKLESIAITEKGSLDKTQYVEGQTPALQGSMTVTATYNNEKTDTIDGYTLQYYVGAAAPGEGDWVSTMPALKTGDTTVYVRAEYDGVYSEAVAYGVTVVAKEVVSVELSNVTFGKTYIEGNTLEAADVSATVQATYNDGSSAKLESGYTVKVSLTDGNWTDSVTLSAGKVTVHVQVSVTGTSVTGTTTKDVDVSAKTLVSISVTTEPTDKEYYVGDSLDKTGMVVTAEYNNGSSEAVTGYTVSPAKFDTAGDAVTVTIAYQGKTAEFTVKVIAVELSSLEVTGTLEKTTYNAGETFSADGLAVKAAYNNGSVDEAFEGATFEFSKTGSGDWSETLSLDKGDTKVYVRAVSGGVTSAAKEFAVAVNVPATDITLNFTEITLENGDSVQLTATAAPSDTTDKVTFTVTEGDEFIDIDDDGNVTAKAVGKAVITVTAGSIEKTVTVWVYETTVTVNLPDAIIVGEQFEFTVTTTLNAPEGMPAITVLGNVELSEGIAVEYYENAGALAGQWVTFVGGHFGPESGFPLTDGATSRFRATVSTETQLTFTVQIIDASVNSTVYAEDVVTVNAVTRALSSIAVTMNPTKTEYAVGETFDPSGMIVTAYYTDGDNEQVTGYTVSPEQFNEAGVIEVTVTYKDGSVTKTATITVTVTSVTIDQDPVTLYVGNDTKNNTATLSAVVEPDAEAVWTIESGGEFISLDGSTVTAIKAGEAVVKVTAGAASDTITIIVKDNVLEYIEISAEPTDREYIVGESLDTEGMVVTAFYTDGTNKTVTESCEVNVSELAEAGEVTVTVTYEGKTDTFAVNVYAVPVSIDANNIRADAGVTIGSEAAENAMNGAIANGFKPGDILYFDFYSDGAGTADITFRLATCYLIGGTDWDNITEMGDMPLDYLVMIKLNGADVALDGMILEGGTSEEYPDIWHIIRDMVFEDMEIRDGLNTFEVAFLIHPEYEDKVPDFAGDGWGTTFCANVDGLIVNATSVGIRTLTGYAINSAPVVGTIDSTVIPSESVNLAAEGDKLLLTFEVNGSVLDLSGLTGYDFEDPTTQDALSEYIERYLPQNMYFDIQNMTNWQNTELDLTLSYEGGKIIATADVSGATIPDGNAFDTRYVTHFGAGSGDNFSPAGDSFTRESVTFNGLKYTLIYYSGADPESNPEYFGCIGFSVERIPESVAAATVTFNENTSTSVVVTYADGTTRKLAEGEYTVSENNVTYSYNGGSLTATISEYTAAYDYTDNANNIKVEVNDNGGVPYLTLGVYFTLTFTAGEDTESARSVAANEVYSALGLNAFDKFDLEANGSFSWIGWNGDNVNRVLSATASGDSLLEYKESGENVYGFEYSVDISSLDKSHYTIHFGADNGSGKPSDYKPGVSLDNSYIVNGVTYQIVCYPDAPEDGTKFWGSIGLIIPSLIPEGNV